MEKFTTELIEQYLENKLNVSERLELEEAMLLNPELKEEVILQKAIALKIEEQALRSLAKEAHIRYTSGNGGSGFLSNGKGIFGITLLIVALAGMLYVVKVHTNDESTDANDTMRVTEAQIADEEIAGLPTVKGTLEKLNGNLPEVQFMTYIFFAEEGAKIKDPRSGAVIKVAANSLIHADGSLVRGEVLLKYREFRNQADIALSRIPMTYQNQNFNSAGMFEIYALQNADTLGISNQSAVSIDFVMTKNEAGIGFYSFDEDKKSWEFIQSLDSRSPELYDFEEGHIGGNGFSGRENFIQRTGKMIMDVPQLSLKDAFGRSLAYQKAAIEGKTIVAELPEKPKGDFNRLFADPDYKQIAGSDTNASNRIVVKEMNKEMKKEKTTFKDFLKKISLKNGGIVIPLNDKPKIDTGLSIVVKDRRYTIYENGKNVVMTELASLKGSQFIYNGKEDFDALTKMALYDVRIKRDTSVLNRFILELKTDGKFLKYELQLSQPDFTAIAEYDKQQRLRMLTYNNRVKLKEKEYQDVVKLRGDQKKLLDSISLYGNENIFRMARLIMTEDELKMSQEQWFASLDTNKALRARIDANLDSIEAYGDHADVYIDKLVKDRKENVESFKDIQKINAGIYDEKYANAGHYFNPLVVNLKIKGFGIFNCDQVYRIENPIAIYGKCVTQDNVEIKDFISISLIDPKVNSAFSFDPRSFTCSSTNDNMLLLFTKDKKIYFFDKAKWKAKQIRRGGFYTFEMIDITSRIKTSEDLQRILEANLLPY